MTAARPETDPRHVARSERLRHDRVRRVGQRRALVVVLVAIAVAGAAFALRPRAVPASSAPGTGAVATVPTRTVEATAPVRTPPATQPATVTPVPKPKPAAPKRLTPAPGVKTIVVDKSDQRVTLYKADGTPADSFLCASGVFYPRVGTYKVWGRAKQSWALTDDTTFFYFTKFATSEDGNSIGFHSIPQEPDGTLVGKLGVPVSHGCVRLDKAKAKFVYTWAATGTRVVVKK
ncbi:MAG TPA: L,D-transpeptidase [Coriobacteriia bacterium]